MQGAGVVTVAQPRESAAANLLIVDDERAIREAAAKWRNRVGFNTFIADTRSRPVKCWAQSVDVVLLDLKLPGAGGLEVLRELRSGGPRPCRDHDHCTPPWLWRWRR